MGPPISVVCGRTQKIVRMWHCRSWARQVKETLRCACKCSPPIVSRSSPRPCPVNTGEAAETADVFRVEIFDGRSGAKAATVDGVTVEARRWKQLGAILAEHAPGETQGYARDTRVSGTNPFIAYGVINDGGSPGERTGDGAFVSSTP